MLSYARGPKRPLFEATIDQAVRDTAERFPDREAVVSRHQNRRLTWREFHSEAERVSRGLARLSLQSQDRVGIWASNCVEWLLLQVACSRANLVLVNVKYFDLLKEMYAKRRMLILDGDMSGKWTVKQEELIRQLGLPKN